jgi:NTE family protein
VEEDPKGDWARHAMRINEVIDTEVSSLRARQVTGPFEAKGGMAGIREFARTLRITASGMRSYLSDRTQVLAQTKTRLKRLDATLDAQLITWGFCSVRCGHAEVGRTGSSSASKAFPYVSSGIS